MMLARAATRKLRRDAFASRAPTRLAEALALPSTLPRLCAVQLRHLSQSPSQWQPQSPSPSPSSSTPTPTHTHTNTHDARRIQRRPSLSPHDHDGARTTTTTSTRSLVTTAELPHSPPSLDGFMQAWGSTVPSPSLSRLNAWDTASPLVVHDHLSHAMPQMRAVAHGITGDPVEMLQNLYACLRVGRTDRAALILKRLSIMYTPRAPEMVDAHNVFLQTLFEQELAQCEPGAGTDAMQTVEQWFQKNMVAKHIAPNAATFVTLLRAAVNFLKGDAQDRQVRALLDMANDCGPDVLEQVNTSPDLTDDEWNTIIRLQPDSFDEPPPVAHLRDMQYNTAHAVRSAVDHGLPVEAAHPHQIRSVDQKGLGLSTLQKALATLHRSDSVPYPHDMEGTPEEKDRAYAYARQLQIEKDGLEAAVERWREEDEKLTDLGIHGVLKNKSLQALMYNWYKALIPMFKQQIAHAKHVTSNPTEDNATDEVNYYGAWLEMCTPERLAANTVSRIVNACVETQTGHGDNLKLATISTLIGNDIMDHINTDAQTRHDKFLKAQRRQARKDLVATLSKTPIEKPDTGVKGPINVSEVPFQKTEIPVSARVKIGALCLEYLLQAARITVTAEDPKTGERVTSTQAGFHHQMMLHQGKKIGWVVPHHEVLAKLRNDPVHNIVSVRLPMVIPPKAWSGFDNGGYYTLPSKVVRQKAGDISQRAYAAAAIENGDMKQVLAGLDTLGKVPWQINKPVLDVMTAAWNTGEGIGALVAEHTTNLEPPPDPPANATYPERAAWGKAMKQYQNTKSGYHSQRCFQNFQLEIANAMAQEKAIYFPHSVDFRGRAYPIPPILNHIGSDVARGLLKFANGKELGSVGLQWLKVHLANLAGFDKASLREREQFAMDNMDEIIDSATKPLDGRRWWAKAEDPWQCLACCMDLKNAFDLPDPTRHVSQLPVHQDGTCNGLQHYAALGGDEAGARQVNLEPSDRPQDIYTGVADLVKAMVDADAEKGVPVATFIKGHISRKVVKRTVMTNVYGVTFMGAKAQVLDTLKDMFPNFRESADMRSLQPVAVYVAFKIFEALGKIFNGAQEIQYWLGECGDRITTSLTPEQIEMIKDRFEGKGLLPDARYKTKKSTKTGTKLLGKAAETFKTGIIWTTPLKMPIVQPYTKDHSVKVKTALQEIIIQKKIGADSVDKRKQLQAFPPNFIHSLDATHMLLSALKCNEVGLEFAAVHDSFWTHACDIPNLNTILRDAFVRMHSEDITGRLAAEFAARYADNMHRANVHAGSDVGVRISKWRIANKSAPTETSEGIGRSYGKASIDELALEAKRQELLKSDDPELRAKGEAMVTPTSIWLEEADPKSLASQRMSLLGETKATKATEATEAAAPLSDKERAVLAEAEALEAATDADLPSETTADGIKETADDAQPPKQRAARPKGSWMAERSIIQVWIPLTFPPVPKKGTWDVTRLRESKYFFS